VADVRVSGLVKAYGATKALDDVSLHFPDGQFFGLLGPSGSGKTTLLRAIAGFVTLDQGRVSIGGQQVEDIAVENREIGMVFQNYALFPNMTVAENVGFGLRVRKLPQTEITKRVREVLELVQLGPFGGRKPDQLSGGQRQRVAMARAIVTRPKVLLLDEPLSALDKALRLDMQIELKRIQREVGITTIFVTHDQEEALTLSDQIGILKDGRLIQHGSPQEVYESPHDAFTARFLGDSNVFQTTVGVSGPALVDGTLFLPPQGAPTGHLAVRCEHIDVSANQNSGSFQLRSRLVQRVYAGANITCVMDWHGQVIKAKGPAPKYQSLPEAGDVWVSWSAEHAVWVR
jgi:putative spermidine/putrescine transport system ATP-binding protein